MEKIKVELYSYNDGEIYDRLLLTEEQLRLLHYLENENDLNCDICVREIEEEIPFKEV